MEEVDMDGSESDQELTGSETDESEWACLKYVLYGQQKIDIKHFAAYACTCI
jgi:hypothetical protein